MTLAEKLIAEYPTLIKEYEEKGIKISTEKLDNILLIENKYNLRFTKIYSDYTYESFVNESVQLRLFLRNKWYSFDEDDKVEKEEIIDFYKREIESDKSFIYEISEISEEFIAYILRFILDSGEPEYIANLKRYLMIRGRFIPKESKFNQEYALDDLIIEIFKSSYITLKIKSKKERGYNFFKSLKNSFLFDFMCRFDAVLTTQTKENNRLFMKPDKYKEKYDKERLLSIVPKLKYNSDLIIHFKKAMSSNDIATQYLSYYHIIEYYFDSVYNKYVIENVKNWLRDPQISLNDDVSILKFVDKVKKLKGKTSEDGQGNEFDALRLVLEKYVDIEKLKLKLKENYSKERIKVIYSVNINEYDIYEFYKNNSVDFLGDNLKIDFNNDSTAYSNIRKRIYETRNSLVHSKDNYTLKTYHPYDNEKDLKKEIPLIKMIAMEIIINSSEEIENM